MLNLILNSLPTKLCRIYLLFNSIHPNSFITFCKGGCGFSLKIFPCGKNVETILFHYLLSLLVKLTASSVKSTNRL